MEDDLEGTLCHGCIHHCESKAKPISPEYSKITEYIFDDNLVKTRINKFEQILAN